MPNKLSLPSALKLIEISESVGKLLTSLPAIDINEYPARQRQGLLNSLDLFHGEIHRIKQEAEAIQPLG